MMGDRPPAIDLHGTALRAAKGFLTGTHRTVAPEATLDRLLPILPRVGVTRLANVTGLDRLGIPVVLAHRPNSPTLSNGAGKGASLVAAKVSAAMEALELQHAEAIALPVVECAYDDLPAYARIPLGRLPAVPQGEFRSDRSEPWIMGWDLVGRRGVAAPWCSVAMVPPRRPSQFTMVTTNGLAGGNHPLEAIAAALYEVVERHSVAGHRRAEAVDGIAWPRLDAATIDDPVTQDLLGRFAAAEIAPIIFDTTGVLDVPCYTALTFDRDLRHTGIHRGYGCHLDPRIALVRALTEAAQARAVLIAGSRDDIFRRDYLANQFGDSTAQIRALEAIRPRAVFGGRPSRSTPTFEGDVGLLLEALTAAGFDQVLAFDLTQPAIGIPVIRIVVPGLDGYLVEALDHGPRRVAAADPAAA